MCVDYGVSGQCVSVWSVTHVGHSLHHMDGIMTVCRLCFSEVHVFYHIVITELCNVVMELSLCVHLTADIQYSFSVEYKIYIMLTERSRPFCVNTISYVRIS